MVRKQTLFTIKKGGGAMHEMGRHFSGIHVLKFSYEISILFTCKASHCHYLLTT